MLSSDHEKVELYISCRKLKNLDVFSKSDPQVRLYTKDKGSWKIFSKTETRNDDLNPNFKTTFQLDFIFEVNQPLLFEVIDVDGPSSFEVIGVAESTLGAIMGAKKQIMILDLKTKAGKIGGKIVIRGEKTGESKNVIFWQWCGVKLMNTDGWLGKSDPFLRFFKKRAGGDVLQVHETEVIMDNLNPVWKHFQIQDRKLCNTHNENFRVECWDWEKSGKYQYIGDCEFSLDDIKSGKREFVLANNPKKKGNTGTLKLLSYSVQERPSFVDFLRGGTQLNSIVAIDFTGSNGIPTQPSSLHAMLPQGLNEYQKAISSVCQIILNYDYDQQVPVFGFGGKPRFPTMTTNTVSHCFPCSGNPSMPDVLGLPGIMEAYSFALRNVELSGPTYFAPLITEACQVCEMNKQTENDAYTILLILTDGEIHDMDATIDILVKAARLPLSIVIVGVGNADFGKMEVLDGDQGLCNSKGQRAERDLVQFVPFRDFNGDMYLLAQRVLAEVPDQLVDYMRLVGKKPRPAQIVDVNALNYSTTMVPNTGNQQAAYQQEPVQQMTYQQDPYQQQGQYQPGNSQQLGYSQQTGKNMSQSQGPTQVYSGSNYMQNSTQQPTQINFTANYPKFG